MGKGRKDGALRENENTNVDPIFQSYESDHFVLKSSAEKGSKKKFEMEDGSMFESKDLRKVSKERKIEDTWFFKVLNELFSPYKVLDQNELLNLIREKYGKFLQ